MGKINYLVANGKADISGNNITYIPVELPPVPTAPGSGNLFADKNYTYGHVKTDISISDGDLSFSYEMDNSSSLFSNTSFQVSFMAGANNIILSFNEGQYMFLLKTWNGYQYNNLLYFGDKSSFDYSATYHAKIILKGGVFKLLINDIEIMIHEHQIQAPKVEWMFVGGQQVRVRDIKVNNTQQKCFIVMQFGNKFDELYENIIKPICAQFNLKPVRADESFNNDFIIHEITSEISEATVIIADITPDNPNVYYEVGYAHALKKNVILMCNEERSKLPFDLSGFRTIFYRDSFAGNSLVKERLSNHLKSIFSVTE